MALTEREKRLRILLDGQLKLVAQAARRLEESLQRVPLAELDELADTPEGAERLDALTSRFARLSDLLIQQIFHLADQLDLESEGTLIDRLNRAEKRGWIGSANDWKRIRELRNRINHEYPPERWKQIVREAIDSSRLVLDCVERTNRSYPQV